MLDRLNRGLKKTRWLVRNILDMKSGPLCEFRSTLRSAIHGKSQRDQAWAGL